MRRILKKSNKVTLRESPNKNNNEGGGGNGKWFTTLVGAGLVIGGAVGLYFVYKTGQAVEREIVGAIRGWKEAGSPALVNQNRESCRSIQPLLNSICSCWLYSYLFLTSTVSVCD